MPTKPDQVWVSDITYISTREGWLYLCVVIDLFSRRVVGISLADNMKASLVVSAFREEFERRQPAKGLIVHSDCGGQYKSKAFRRLLWAKGARQSMTHAENCYDNANAESFFGTLKRELIRGTTFLDRASAISAIFEYIEVFYNRLRLHSSLGYESPEQFEQKTA